MITKIDGFGPKRRIKKVFLLEYLIECGMDIHGANNSEIQQLQVFDDVEVEIDVSGTFPVQLKAYFTRKN